MAVSELPRQFRGYEAQLFASLKIAEAAPECAAHEQAGHAEPCTPQRSVVGHTVLEVGNLTPEKLMLGGRSDEGVSEESPGGNEEQEQGSDDPSCVAFANEEGYT